jgi:DNA-directed RNA polymerase
MRSRVIRQLMYDWHRELEKVLKLRLEELCEKEARDWPIANSSGVEKMWTGEEFNLLLTRICCLILPFPVGSVRNRPDLIHPLLSLLTPSALSMLTIQEILRMQGSGGIENGTKTTRTVISIGRAVETEWNTLKQKSGGSLQIIPDDEAPKLVPSSNLGDGNNTSAPFFFLSNLDSLYASRIQHRKLMEIDERWNWSSDWTQVTRAKIGAFLVDALMSVAKIEVRVKKKQGPVDNEESSDNGESSDNYQ